MSVLRQLYRGENDFDIVGKFKIGVSLSALLVLISIASLFGRGLNLGIDFEGGSAFTITGDAGISVADTRDALRPIGLESSKIQVLGGDTLRVQVKDVPDAEREAEIRQTLADHVGTDVTEVSLTSVGPSWGDEITSKAQRALVFFLILVMIYIALRFEPRMAAAAFVAMAHDVIVSVGFYSVFQIEVTPATVIAFLTILGYSLYDTIVVFDRVNENALLLAASGRATYSDMVNLSMNEVMMRSINTSITSLLPVTSMLVVGSFVLGAATLEEFAIALMVGLVAGTYSSIFTAAPVLVALKQRQPRHAERASRTTRSTDDDEIVATVRRDDVTATIKARPRRKRRR